MHFLAKNALSASCLVIFLFINGCVGNGLGDPCQPETVPPGGFNSSEVYLETSSVQCRTRLCMVYKLDGEPSTASSTDIDQRLFCSCRCDLPSGTDSNSALCECGEGYACQEVVRSGGGGVVGSYCVPCRDDANMINTNLSTDFPNCPAQES